jgi:hypothetical protein
MRSNKNAKTFNSEPNMNLYRLTVKDQVGARSVYDEWNTTYKILERFVQESSETISAENIDPNTGRVLGGFYKE